MKLSVAQVQHSFKCVKDKTDVPNAGNVCIFRRRTGQVVCEELTQIRFLSGRTELVNWLHKISNHYYYYYYYYYYYSRKAC
jgi:hypothetical protein